MAVLSIPGALRTIAHLCMTVGYLCIALFVLGEWQYDSARASAVELMHSQSRAPGAQDLHSDWFARVIRANREVDQSWWSASRIEHYRAALTAPPQMPLAVLRIRELSFEVPVFGDTSDASLDLGAGVIEGMALPGKGGNLGIAGHRDGFFRTLRHIAPGITAEVETPTRTYLYRIDRVRIVDSDDASSLADTDESSLTLVTCYPFFYIGAAPQRFVAQGSLLGSMPLAVRGGV